MDEFMQAAIQEAKQGRQEGGIPIGPNKADKKVEFPLVQF